MLIFLQNHWTKNHLLEFCKLSKTKHIALHYHFIKDHVEDDNIEVHFVKTIDQLADIFTKSLDEKIIC